MKCLLVRRHIGAFVDGELDPGTQVDFERHMDACAVCQEHLGFERVFRDYLRESISKPEAPESLKARLVSELDRYDKQCATQYKAMGWRRALPWVAAAAVLLLVVGVFGALETNKANTASMASMSMSAFEDVVQLHASRLPSDVEPSDVEEEAVPQQVTDYFQGKVAFPVRPAEFDRQDVRLVGARVSHVRGRHAAALFYEALGRRVTVVVFDKPIQAVTEHVYLDNREVGYQFVRGHAVSVRRHRGLNYVFTSDLDRETLVQLAASARMTF